VHLNKHDFFHIYIYCHYQGAGAINLKYTSVLTVALSDCISFVKELLTSGNWNRLPVDSTDFGSLHRFRNSLDAIDDTILVDAQ